MLSCSTVPCCPVEANGGPFEELQVATGVQGRCMGADAWGQMHGGRCMGADWRQMHGGRLGVDADRLGADRKRLGQIKTDWGQMETDWGQVHGGRSEEEG